MHPTGPSPRMNGNFDSSSSASIMAGIQKANVFPEPVKAIPIISRPANLSTVSGTRAAQNDKAYAVGMPCIWMGVGVTILLDLRYLTMTLGIFMS